MSLWVVLQRMDRADTFCLRPAIRGSNLDRLSSASSHQHGVIKCQYVFTKD
jgi:hypothetical protein